MEFYDIVVVGGNGAVGSLIASLLASGEGDDSRKVLALDRSAPPTSAEGIVDLPAAGIVHRTADVLDPDEELLAVLQAASIVVLALPESTATKVPLSYFGAGSLVVETLSVKSGFAAKVGAEDPSCQVLGINPMFAPSLGMQGRPVATVTHRPGKAVEVFKNRIDEWGGRGVEVDAETHDRLAAATQALTHASVLAFGSALASIGVDSALVEALAPPPARTSLALLARITGGEPEVYWDVQAGNPFAATARRALADAVRELDHAVESGSEAEFTALMQRAGAVVPDGYDYSTLCARLFGIVREPARDGGRP